MYPGDARLGDGGIADLRDVDGGFITVCVGDAEFPDDSLDGTDITLEAIKNNGDPVDLVGGTVEIIDGCAIFDQLTIDKTGAYRLVANGEFESVKFNVRPARKK